MLFAAHMLVAGTVGEAIGNPFLAFFVGIVIHMILDQIPHFDSPDKGKPTLRQWALALSDMALGFILLVYLFNSVHKIDTSFIAGAVGGVIIDVFDVFPLWRKQFRQTKIGKVVHQIHSTYHAQSPGVILGMVTQYTAVVLAYFLYRLIK